MNVKNGFGLLYNFVFRTKRRGLTVRAVLLAAIARFRVRFYPSSRLHAYLGERGAETGTDAITDIEALRNLRYVSERVARVAKRVPWESKCLVQAMVAQRLLRSYGLRSTLYLGVSRDTENAGKMVAHAWVRCGPYAVCGGNGTGYASVAKFVM